MSEHVPAVRPSYDEAEEIVHFFVGESSPLTGIPLEGADLSIHHFAQTEPARHGTARILVLEQLSRQVLIPQRLEEAECHQRMDAASSTALGGLAGRKVGHRGSTRRS